MKINRFRQRTESIAVLCAFIFISLFSEAQNPLVKMWDKRFGGTSFDELTCFQQTNDNGYILGGNSNSGVGGDKTHAQWGNSADNDYWIIKIDSIGNKQWDKSFGGTSSDYLFSIQQTFDSGYILAGRSFSQISGVKSQPSQGGSDYWIVKIDSNGDKQWDKTYGGFQNDYLTSAKQTNDHGFLLAGWSWSGVGGDKTQPLWGTIGSCDFWILKIDSLGTIQWQKDLGGTSAEKLYSFDICSDGGYVLAGISNSSIGGNKSQDVFGIYDYWVIKIDSSGDVEWDNDFGGLDNDILYSIRQTSDLGFILAGYSISNVSGNKTEPLWSNAMPDYWIVKIDSSGNKQWERDFGGTNYENYQVNSIQTSDGKYLIAGNSDSQISGNKTENNLGVSQAWIISTDSLGNFEWDKTIFTSPESGTSPYILKSIDGCYVIAKSSFGGVFGYKSQQNWDTTNVTSDYWIIKFCDSTLTTSIADKESEHITLFPNPTEGVLTIGSLPTGQPGWQKTISKIEIFNTLGERMYFASSNCESCIVHCEFLSPGIYFVKAIAGEKVLFGKVAKE